MIVSRSSPSTTALDNGRKLSKLRTIQPKVAERREEFLEAWNEFFGIGSR